MKIKEVESAKLFEKWSKKYKRSIDCSHPKGFSQQAHCDARKARQSGKKTKSKSVSEGDVISMPEVVNLSAWKNSDISSPPDIEEFSIDRQGFNEIRSDLESEGYTVKIHPVGTVYSNGKLKQGTLSEDSMSLHDWFGKGKHGGAGGGGWDRYNTKGERIGKCGERKPGEGKPKCLSKARAASLRASGGKKAIASAVNKKRREDPNPKRKGKARMVSNRKSVSENKKSSQKFANTDLVLNELAPSPGWDDDERSLTMKEASEIIQFYVGDKFIMKPLKSQTTAANKKQLGYKFTPIDPTRHGMIKIWGIADSRAGEYPTYNTILYWYHKEKDGKVIASGRHVERAVSKTRANAYRTAEMILNHTDGALRSDMGESFTQQSKISVKEGDVIKGNFGKQSSEIDRLLQLMTGQEKREQEFKRLAAFWYFNDESPIVEKKLANIGWEIGTVDEDEHPGVFVVETGDENGDSYMAWTIDELKNLKESSSRAIQHTSRKLNMIEPTDQQSKIIDTANHMINLHKDSSYTPAERADDHAMSYESSDPRFAYWTTVRDEILKRSK